MNYLQPHRTMDGKDNPRKYDFSNLQQWLDDGLAVPIFVDGVVQAAASEIVFECARCRTTWTCPTLTITQRGEIAGLVRGKRILEPFSVFRSAGFTPAAAKRTMEHITIIPGKCHKCSRVLSEDQERVVCRCRSLNLNW